MTRKINWPALSATRFVLACVVVACHMTNAISDNAVINAVTKLSGFAAVAGFLVISGLSISHSIHRQKEGYWNRRIDRIYPAYLCSIILTVCIMAAVGGVASWPNGTMVESPTRWELVGNALMLQQLVCKQFAANPVVWSLALEELMYVLCPLFLKCSRRTIWFLIGASFIANMIGNRLGFGYYNQLNSLMVVVSLSWLWLLGWQLQTAPESERTRTAVLALACIGVTLSPMANVFAVATIAVAVSVVIHNRNFVFNERTGKALTWLGHISYPLYICHWPTMLAVWCFTKSTNPLAYIGAVLLVSIVIHHGVELPFRKYRKWQQSKASRVVHPVNLTVAQGARVYPEIVNTAVQ